MRRVFVDYVQEGKCQIRFPLFPEYLHKRTGEPLESRRTQLSANGLLVETGRIAMSIRIFVVVFVPGSGIHDHL